MKLLSPLAAPWLKIPKGLRWLIALGLPLLLLWFFWPSKNSSLPSVAVRSGEFIIDLKEPGKLRAENSVTISAPPARVNLQIIDLTPEGTRVKEGDLLVQFDTTELKQQLDDQIAELDIAKSNLLRSRASMSSHMASLQSSLENSRASYRLAELRLEQMKFEADVKVEEGRLSLRQSEISLKQSEAEITAQLQIDSADVRSLELKVKQAEFDIQKTRLDLARLRMTAPGTGLVVYKEIWRGGEMSKIKIGDTPWRGAALIELPDLSLMQVATSVSEVDFSKVKVGQKVDIKLDAYPDPTFHGEVIDVAVLAHAEEGQSEAKLFDVVVRVDGSDPMLRPGMSATATIIVDRLENKLFVPIESVFDKGGRMVVFATDNGSFEERTVTLGARNDNFVVIEDGVREGERVALVDPTADIDDQTTSTGKGESKIGSEEGGKPNSTASRQGSNTGRRGQGGGWRRNH